MAIYAIDTYEILNIVLNFKTKFCFYRDYIPVSSMKASIYNVPNPISNIIDCSLVNGSYPYRSNETKCHAYGISFYKPLCHANKINNKGLNKKRIADETYLTSKYGTPMSIPIEHRNTNRFLCTCSNKL